jgi:hypothetical protein
MDTWRSQWIERKVGIARRFDAGECGAGYAEAVMILCAAISALAAEIWPGKGKDRARFVQLLIEFAPPDLDPTRLSIPLLIGGLRQSSLMAEAADIENSFLRFDRSRVLTGDEVDRPENEVLSLCPTLSTKFLRPFTYASLLYEEVRSAYVHQYSTGDRADSWPMTSKEDASVSYVNWVNDPNRHIHFHIEWVAHLAMAAAKSIESSSMAFPRPDPNTWWIYGTDP